jgi:hypothetical protein
LDCGNAGTAAGVNGLRVPGRPFCFRVPDRGSKNPTPLGGWDRGASGVDWLDGSTWQPYGLGLQVPPCLGDEVPVPDEMWVDYVKNQTPLDPDDNFNVT